MKIMQATLALVVLTTLGTSAHGQARSREDVLRELAEARRMGDIVISGCGGGTYREAFPNRYPPREVSAVATATTTAAASMPPAVPVPQLSLQHLPDRAAR